MIKWDKVDAKIHGKFSRDFPYFLCIVGFFTIYDPTSCDPSDGRWGVDVFFRIHLANVHNAWAGLGRSHKIRGPLPSRELTYPPK